MQLICQWNQKVRFKMLLTVIGFSASVFSSFAESPYLVRTFEENGRQIDEVSVPGRPPAVQVQARSASVSVPSSNIAAGINVLSNVPAFCWSYGCAPTAAAMIMGYYDNRGYVDMYTGPANGGVCPMSNIYYWGWTEYSNVISGECPLSATHQGIDNRANRGHVDDYWIDYLNCELDDPYIFNGWPERTPDCLADYMGVNQVKFGMCDAETRFLYAIDGSPLCDYTNQEPDNIRDGCHGMKLFANSRGYMVTTNFTQLIYGLGTNVWALPSMISRAKSMMGGLLSFISMDIAWLVMDTTLMEPSSISMMHSMKSGKHSKAMGGNVLWNAALWGHGASTSSTICAVQVGDI